MAHLFNSGRRCVPSLGSLALASVRHAPAIYRKNVALTLVRGHPPQVVQIRLGNASTNQIADLLRARAEDIEKFVTANRESVFMLRE